MIVGDHDRICYGLRNNIIQMIIDSEDDPRRQRKKKGMSAAVIPFTVG